MKISECPLCFVKTGLGHNSACPGADNRQLTMGEMMTVASNLMKQLDTGNTKPLTQARYKVVYALRTETFVVDAANADEAINKASFKHKLNADQILRVEPIN